MINLPNTPRMLCGCQVSIVGGDIGQGHPRGCSAGPVQRECTHAERLITNDSFRNVPANEQAANCASRRANVNGVIWEDAKIAESF